MSLYAVTGDDRGGPKVQKVDSEDEKVGGSCTKQPCAGARHGRCLAVLSDSPTAIQPSTPSICGR